MAAFYIAALLPCLLCVQVRDWIVPVNRRHKLSDLAALLRRHYAAGNPLGRRALIEYTMLAGVNDSLDDAHGLVELLQGIEAKVRGTGGWAGGCLTTPVVVVVVVIA